MSGLKSGSPPEMARSTTPEAASWSHMVKASSVLSSFDSFRAEFDEQC
ncbi:MAG TPA: hypothetical protein VFK05_16335 [Polyangiaceae bacterium]|nr:hypothetical protein [Polyangiaceae bacterium]